LESRIRRALFLYIYSVLGVFLLVAPWTPVWEQAARGLLAQPLQGWMLSGWIRGVVSGLGVLDLAVAAQYGAEFFGHKGNAPSDQA
jgi:hypothetical protein